jgi:hypothetical protein
MKKVTGEPYDIFCFIAVEDKEPYKVGVFTLSQGFIEAGRSDYQRLINIESRCRAANFWPNYNSAEVTELEPPRYLAA